MIEFIVLSTQRTGSTWVVDMLNSHPQVVAYSELFLADATGTPRYGGSKDRTFWSEYQREGRGELDDYLDHVFEPRSGVEAVGFKLMYTQAGAVPGLMDRLRQRHARIVHLMRRNVFDVLVSREASTSTEVFHLRDGEQAPSIRVNLDTSDLVARLESESRIIERARAEHSGAGEGYLEVFYEDLVAGSSWPDLLSFLSVDTTVELSSGLRKVHPTHHERLVENIDSVRDTLSGTRWLEFVR